MGSAPIKSQTATPASTTAPPAYNPHDQPAIRATAGVTTGASIPPRLPPVLKIAPPVPACLPLASMAAAQYGPSELAAKPSDRHSRITVGRVPVTFEPTNTRRALSVNPTTGTIRRPL